MEGRAGNFRSLLAMEVCELEAQLKLKKAELEKHLEYRSELKERDACIIAKNFLGMQVDRVSHHGKTIFIEGPLYEIRVERKSLSVGLGSKKLFMFRIEDLTPGLRELDDAVIRFDKDFTFSFKRGNLQTVNRLFDMSRTAIAAFYSQKNAKNVLFDRIDIALHTEHGITRASVLLLVAKYKESPLLEPFPKDVIILICKHAVC
jgi:hypothetical protein